jgi:DHA2 family methylenomycin A resistance protein-like MFS transporter
MVVVSQVASWGITNPIILASIVVAPAALTAFVAIERRVASPLLPLEFFTRRDFTASVIASFFTNAAYMGAFYITGLMMLRMFDYSATGAVPILSIRPAVFFLASPLGGWVATRRGNRFGAVARSRGSASGCSGRPSAPRWRTRWRRRTSGSRPPPSG